MLAANITGIQNAAVRANALVANTTVSNNCGLGYFTLKANITGTDNIALDAYCLQNNTTDNRNTLFGSQALQANIAESDNIGLGYLALYNCKSRGSVAIGSNAEIAVGNSFLPSVTTGAKNICICPNTDSRITAGLNNILIGDTARTGTNV